MGFSFRSAGCGCVLLSASVKFITSTLVPTFLDLSTSSHAKVMLAPSLMSSVYSCPSPSAPRSAPRLSHVCDVCDVCDRGQTKSATGDDGRDVG